MKPKHWTEIYATDNLTEAMFLESLLDAGKISYLLENLEKIRIKVPSPQAQEAKSLVRKFEKELSQIREQP